MYEILKAGGLTKGGVNSTLKSEEVPEPEDLFYTYYWYGLICKRPKVAAKLIEDKVIDKFIEERYSSYKSGIGLDIVSGKANFHTLEQYALQNPVIKNVSGKQEIIKSLVNQYLFG